MALIIRQTKKSDIEDIIRLWKGNLITNNTPAEIRKMFKSHSRYFFLAEDNNKDNDDNNRVIGFIAGRSLPGKGGHIDGIAIEKEYQGKGIGSQLLNAVENKFIENNIDKVFLEVRESNDNARKFYEKREYKSIKCNKVYYTNGENAILYKKEFMISYKSA